ncbi:MAG: hypothetical protein PUI24_05865 [Spirochaetales bacterium]|nr:hypothetical protein [Spirochaetia bacterium]MDD7014489.1 hypothetical protein [Spirochaetales bacterium]
MNLLNSLRIKTAAFAKRILYVTAAVCSLFVFNSCKKSTDPKKFVIWTDNTEVVSYVEIFNSTHKDVKAVVIYKESVATSLPPAHDEIQPDIIIGSWLKNQNVRKYFTPLDFVFKNSDVHKNEFYDKLLAYGNLNEKQYLLPVSFNLPAMIFSRQNEDLISSEHFLNLSQIKSISREFNVQGKNSDSFTSMGYGISWNPNFLYEATKLNQVEYMEKGSSFNWNSQALEETIVQMKEWTAECNGDTSTEQNFQFRYLYMPEYRQVTTGRCLFACTTSNNLFTLNDNQTEGLSFRWLESNGTIPVEDDLTCLGIYKKSRNLKQCASFINWFFREDTQTTLLERSTSMKLDSVVFGIAGGFSSMKTVNEKVFPVFYHQLLGNLPGEKYLVLPKILPARWQSLKQKVILPYLVDSTKTDSDKYVESLENRIRDWSKQFY